jgi:hypothetical protein
MRNSVNSLHRRLDIVAAGVDFDANGQRHQPSLLKPPTDRAG